MDGTPGRGLGARAPVSIRDTLQRRLSRLAPGEREVLEIAAVLGDGGDVSAVAAAWPAEPGKTLAALDTAARFGLVDSEELAGGRVAFPHMLTRQAVLDLVDPSRLALLHARVGEVLASQVDAGFGSWLLISSSGWVMWYSLIDGQPVSWLRRSLA